MEYDETNELRRYVRANLEELAKADEWEVYRALLEQAGTEWDAYRAQIAEAGSEPAWNIQNTELDRKTFAEIEAETVLHIERLDVHRQKLEDLVIELSLIHISEPTRLLSIS